MLDSDTDNLTIRELHARSRMERQHDAREWRKPLPPPLERQALRIADHLDAELIDGVCSPTVALRDIWCER